MQVLLGNLENGQIGKDFKGQYWTMTSLGLSDELGVFRYPESRGVDYDTPLTLVNRPTLMAGDFFSWVLPKTFPNWGSRVIFRMGYNFQENAWRFPIHLNGFGISIPFHFKSSDPRIPGLSVATWTSKSSGKLIDYIRRSEHLVLEFNKNEPVLKLTINMKPRRSSKPEFHDYMVYTIPCQ